MIKVFVPHTVPSGELMGVIRSVEAAGYDKNQAFVGNDFNEFIKQFQSGDTVVIYSLNSFRSVTEILSVVAQLAQRNVTFHSASEPWFNDPALTPKELLSHLFQLGEHIHRSTVPVPRTSKKRSSGTHIEARVSLAHELRTTQRLSVAQACHRAGCSISAYYAHQKKR